MDNVNRQIATSKDSSREGQKIRLWVIHDEESPERTGSAWANGQYLARPEIRASIHALVDAEEVVGQVDWSRAAWHANHGATNACSIGVEHEGYARQTRDEWLDPFRGQRTLHRSAELFAKVGMGVYGIAPVRLTGDALINCVIKGIGSGFCGHKDVTLAFKITGGHTDPGDWFPYDAWGEWARVAAAPPPPAPAPTQRRGDSMQIIDNADGRLERFKIDGSGHIVHTWQKADCLTWNDGGAGSAGYVPLAGASGAIPGMFVEFGVGRLKDGRLNVVAIGAYGNEFAIKQATNGGWEEWARIS